MASNNRSSVLITSLKSQERDDLAQRVDRYFHRHPEVSRESFLRNALSREISERERNSRSGFAVRTIDAQEDERNHAWLEERLDAVRHERQGIISKLRGIFFGSH